MNWKRMRTGRRFLLAAGLTLVLTLGLVGSAAWAAETETYIIRSGDTLMRVAAAYETTMEKILALNPGLDANNLYVGRTIQVPVPPEPGTVAAQCPRSYTTRAGDTWNSIAASHQVNAGVLALVNNKAQTQALAVGTELCIPVVPPAATRTPTPTTPAVATKTPTPVAVVAKPTAIPEPGVGEGDWYTVAPRDYLARIASDNECTSRVLAQVNKNQISNPSLIHAGMRIWIPADCDSLQELLPALPRPPVVAAPRPAPQPAPAAPRPSRPVQVAPPPPAAAAAPVAPAAPAAPASFAYRGAQGPWNARYFNNRDVQGNAAVSRQDPQIVFRWGRNSPVSGVRADGFSVQWTGTFHFTGQEYRFVALADDGIRVWVDNALIINGWQDQSPTMYFRDYTPRYGNRTIRVEYYDDRSDATAVVNWAPTRR